MLIHTAKLRLTRPSLGIDSQVKPDLRLQPDCMLLVTAIFCPPRSPHEQPSSAPPYGLDQIPGIERLADSSKAEAAPLVGVFPGERTCAQGGDAQRGIDNVVVPRKGVEVQDAKAGHLDAQ